MRLTLKLPVDDFDILQGKLDSCTRGTVNIDRRVFVLLMQDYENPVEKCQEAGVDVVFHASVNLSPKGTVVR